MKNIKNNIIKILFGILISISFASCDAGGDPEAGGTTTQNFAGDWYINVKFNGVDKVIRFSTYNTSANDNTMFIDDNGFSQTLPSSQLLKAKYTINLMLHSFLRSQQLTPYRIDLPFQYRRAATNGCRVHPALLYHAQIF